MKFVLRIFSNRAGCSCDCGGCWTNFVWGTLWQ